MYRAATTLLRLLRAAPTLESAVVTAERHSAGRRWPIWGAAGVVAAIAFEVYLLFVQAHGTPRTSGAGASWVGELAGAKVYSQTIRIDASGWYEIAFRARPHESQVQGDAVIEIVDVLSQGTERLLFRRVIPAAELVKSSWYRHRFPPLDDTAGRLFRLDVRLPTTPAGFGLALAKTYDNPYRQGALYIEGRERWEDLVFTTRATRATVFGNLQRLWSDWPPVMGLILFWTILIVYTLALVTFVAHVLRMRGPSYEL